MFVISEHIAKRSPKIEQSVGVEQIVAGNSLHRTERSEQKGVRMRAVCVLSINNKSQVAIACNVGTTGAMAFPFAAPADNPQLSQSQATLRISYLSAHVPLVGLWLLKRRQTFPLHSPTMSTSKSYSSQMAAWLQSCLAGIQSNNRDMITNSNVHNMKHTLRAIP